MSSNSLVHIYTDGASRGNPGPGGYGACLSYTDATGTEHTRELSGGFQKTTNNRMELLAVIKALEVLKQPCQVELYSDSQYVVRAFTEGWIESWQLRGWKNANKQPVKNIDLWQRLLRAGQDHSISWHWVKGHAGNELNERADQLATAAADGDALDVDEGFQDDEGLL